MIRPRAAVTAGVLVAAVLLIAMSPLVAQDLLVADFEGVDYGDWQVEGEAFGDGPARGTLPGQMQVSGYLGQGLVNSYRGGDGTTGTLTSPGFRIQRRYLNFLVGGGMHPGKTCMNLLVDGRVVRTVTGPNDRPGGSERLEWHSWDVEELRDRSVVLQIVDQATGGWGHVNIDHILQSDVRRQVGPASRQLAVDRRYLHLPVKNGAPRRRLRLEVDGEVAREFEIELAEQEPDFWVFADLSPFRGATLSVAADRLPPDSAGLAGLRLSDQVPGAEQLYRERYRPQFHFSSRRGWNNDPNGLVYHAGEYHLFYQHNPYGWSWGNMHWGHAVSRDLVHWQELPIALYPRSFGDWCFSGGAVVDVADTAGFQAGEDPAIVAFYTSTGRGECVAYSNDRGRTFAEFAGNPVVRHRGRDPKVIWYEPGPHWVMAVYDEHDGGRFIAFYTSPDLKEWQFASRIEGFYECPELFELAVDGDPEMRRWVLHGADGSYAIGDFDGRSFTPQADRHRGNHGNCFYASQTFSDVPPADGRRIQIGWGRVAMPGMPFNQMMLFPCELTLRTTPDGIRVFTRPVQEIELLHLREHRWSDRPLTAAENPLAALRGELFHIRAELELRPGEDGEPAAQQVGFEVRGIPILYDRQRQELTCQELRAPLDVGAGPLRLEILVDRTSVEIFAADGALFMPVGVILDEEDRSLATIVENGVAWIRSLEVFELQSAWR